MGPLGRFVGDGGDQTGIQSAREDDSYRDISHQPLLDALNKGFEQGRCLRIGVQDPDGANACRSMLATSRSTGLPESVSVHRSTVPGLTC